MSNVLYLYVISGVLTACSVIVFFLPGAKPSAPAPPEIAEPEPAQFASLAQWFDAGPLPKPKPAESVAAAPAPPPPDVAAGLRRYRFIGLAASDARAAGVFERDGATLVLAPGAALEGFTLQSVSTSGALFSSPNNLDVTLRLESIPG